MHYATLFGMNFICCKEWNDCLMFVLGFLIHTQQWCYNACIAESVTTPYAVNLFCGFLSPWLSLRTYLCLSGGVETVCMVNCLIEPYVTKAAKPLYCLCEFKWKEKLPKLETKKPFPPVGGSTCIERKQIKTRFILNQCCPVLVSEVANVCMKSLSEGEQYSL